MIELMTGYELREMLKIPRSTLCRLVRIAVECIASSGRRVGLDGEGGETGGCLQVRQCNGQCVVADFEERPWDAHNMACLLTKHYLGRSDLVGLRVHDKPFENS